MSSKPIRYKFSPSFNGRIYSILLLDAAIGFIMKPISLTAPFSRA